VFLGATGSGGNLTVAARSLSLQNTAGLLAVTLGSGNAGTINVQADTIGLTDVGARANPSQMGSIVFAGANGNAGDLNITTRSLSVTNGAQIVATTFGNGNAGAIAIDASESATFAGVNGSFFSGAISTVEQGATGRGSNIRLSTKQLSITEGAQIRTTTRGADAGDIDISADTLSVSGVGSNQRPSAIASAVLTGGTGNGSEINIQTRTASFADGATLSANTSSAIGGTQGNAGNIRITASDAVTFDGIGAGGFNTSARVETFGAGQGGTLSLDTPQLALTGGGQLRSTTNGSGDAGNIFIRSTDEVLAAGVNSGLFANTEPGSSGNGGRIVIASPEVALRDRAQISVDSQGTGVGGNIQIQGDSLTLSNQSTISAETNSSAGGDIDLQTQDLVLLRQGSRISTTAGKAQGQGDGGNIGIRTNFIVAVKTENSDITANAFLGRGGRVDITAQGVYGIDYRDRLTPLSDITVSSELGLAGVVTVNGIIIDPERGLVALPTNLVDAAGLIAQGCSAQGETVARQLGEFVVTGRGGVPSSPNDALNSQSVWQDLRPLSSATAHNSATQATVVPTSTAIVEAQRWLMDSTGQISLVAHASTGSLVDLGERSLPCPTQSHQAASQ
jgi:large exoprotein involved in heme utilization and adhesion